MLHQVDGLSMRQAYFSVIGRVPIPDTVVPERFDPNGQRSGKQRRVGRVFDPFGDG